MNKSAEDWKERLWEFVLAWHMAATDEKVEEYGYLENYVAGLLPVQSKDPQQTEALEYQPKGVHISEAINEAAENFANEIVGKGEDKWDERDKRLWERAIEYFTAGARWMEPIMKIVPAQSKETEVVYGEPHRNVQLKESPVCGGSDVNIDLLNALKEIMQWIQYKDGKMFYQTSEQRGKEIELLIKKAAAQHKESTSDAIEFAEWLHEHSYEYNTEDKIWTHPDRKIESQTTEQLYKTFKSHP